MAKIKTNKFTTVIFETKEEEDFAKTFSTPNLLYLASLRSQAAITRLALMYDPNNNLKFLQQEAYLKARIDLLTELMGEDSQSNEGVQ